MLIPDDYLLLFDRYMAGKASEAETACLKEWIKNNPALAEWLEQQVDASASEMDPSTRHRIFGAVNRQITEVRTQPGSKRIRSGWLQLAAMLLLPLMSALGVYMYMAKPTQDAQAPYRIAVDYGQKAEVTLPDGTKVWLNSKSVLSCSTGFNTADRNIYLTGEAFFEVVPDKYLPFRVVTKDVTVEALGTSFVVKAYDEDNTVSSILIEGKVRVATPHRQVLLQPSQRLEYDKDIQEATVAPVANAADYAAWRNNELRFENESLQEIAKEIERAYAVEILFESEELARQRFTGTLNNSSLQHVLNIIAITASSNFTIKNEQIIFHK